MYEKPSLELRNKRWENAKSLTQKFIEYCETNQYDFMFEDYSKIISASNIHITEDKILVVLENHPKIITYIIYDNTDSFYNNSRESTHHWYVENILFNAAIVKQMHSEHFLYLQNADLDSIETQLE